jgi:hypothetical protein
MLSLFSLLCLNQSLPGNGFNSGDSSASALTSLPADSQLHQLSLFSSRTPLQLSLNPSDSESQSYFTTGGLPPIIRLCDKPLETHNQHFFLNEHLLS